MKNVHNIFLCTLCVINAKLSAKEILHKKWPNAKYIGYFQNNSNTYVGADELKDMNLYSTWTDFETYWVISTEDGIQSCSHGESVP